MASAAPKSAMGLGAPFGVCAKPVSNVPSKGTIAARQIGRSRTREFSAATHGMSCAKSDGCWPVALGHHRSPEDSTGVPKGKRYQPSPSEPERISRAPRFPRTQCREVVVSLTRRSARANAQSEWCSGPTVPAQTVDMALGDSAESAEGHEAGGYRG
jgi:hypothetical protein